MRTPEVIVAGLTTLAILGGLLTVHLRRRGKRQSHEEADRANPSKFDTTLGEFHGSNARFRPTRVLACAPSPKNLESPASPGPETNSSHGPTGAAAVPLGA